MGTQTCLEVYRAVPDMIYSVCEVFGPFMVEKGGGFEMTINDSPFDISATNTMWIPHQIFSGIACVDMLFILAATINLLMQLDFFKKASNAVTLRAPQRGAKAWIIDIVFSIVIPAIIFVPVSAYVIL